MPVAAASHRRVSGRGGSRHHQRLEDNGDAALKPHLGLSRLADSVQQLIEQRQIGDRHVGHAEKYRGCRHEPVKDVGASSRTSLSGPRRRNSARRSIMPLMVCARPRPVGAAHPWLSANELVEHAGKPVRVVEVREVPRSLEDHDAAVRHRLLCRDGVP